MDPRTHYRTGRPLENVVGKRLTDRRIAKYEKAGWYSPEMKQARKALAERKAGRKREGEYIRMEDGRLIYSPR